MKKKVSDETQQKLDKWMSGQLLGEEMKEILKKANYDPTTPDIESFKNDTKISQITFVSPDGEKEKLIFE